MITNGGFDTVTTGWTAQNSAILASVAGGQAGNCLQITEAGVANPQCYQDITTVIGQAYDVALYVKQGTATGWQAWKSDTDGSDVVYAVTSSGQVATAGWVQFAFQFPATDTTSRLTLRHIAIAAAGTTVLFDTVSMLNAYTGDAEREYGCYYSYVGKYIDGSEHETDLSPVLTISRTGNAAISWTSIPASTDPQVTHKRLYRSYLGSIWYVAEITNATLTYSDTMTDAELVASTVFENTGYYPPPDNIWMVLEHYRRLFVLVEGDYSHWIFWSEPQDPLAFIYDEDTALYANGTDVFHKGNPCTGMAKWGGELFIASSSGFRRLVGSSPSYWALRDTLTQIGNVARYAMQTTRWGLLHLWWDGVYLFNGYNSTKLTSKNEAFFKGINWDAADEIRSVFDGKVFRLLVPYGTSSIPNRAFVMDFETYPRIRCYEEDQGESVALFDVDENQVWYGKTTNVGWRDGDSEVSMDIYSKAFAVANLIQLDGAARLHYEINTGGKDVTLTVYHDNVAHDTTITLNTQGRERNVVSIPLKNARTIALRLTGEVDSEVEIYEPWIFSN